MMKGKWLNLLAILEIPTEWGRSDPTLLLWEKRLDNHSIEIWECSGWKQIQELLKDPATETVKSQKNLLSLKCSLSDSCFLASGGSCLYLLSFLVEPDTP